MRNEHDRSVRDALWRLSVARVPSSAHADGRQPLFLRAPAIIALWGATLFAAVGLLAISRVQIPRVARGPVVAVPAAADTAAFLLLLPPAARAAVRVGQTASVDTGADTLALDVIGVDSLLLDAPAARKRFGDVSGVVVQLSMPRLVVHLARCGEGRCLTPHVGAVYTAWARVGRRSLASYAMSGS